MSHNILRNSEVHLPSAKKHHSVTSLVVHFNIGHAHILLSYLTRDDISTIRSSYPHVVLISVRNPLSSVLFLSF